MLDGVRQLNPSVWVVVVLAVLVVTLVLYDAVFGRRDYIKFVSALESTPSERTHLVRASFLLKWAWQPWVLTAIALAFVALASGIDLRHLGLVWPDFSSLLSVIDGGAALGGAVLGVVIGMAVVLIAGVVIGIRSKTRHKDGVAAETAGAKPQPAVNPKVEAMLPTAREDRRAWLLVSFTAGVTEEIMYRGLILLTLGLVLPAAPPMVIYALAILAFALAHAYQGWAGVITTGILGAVFMGLFVSTSSLVPGMVLHFLIDARAALTKPLSAESRQ